jgi:hypothetical protein
MRKRLIIGAMALGVAAPATPQQPQSENEVVVTARRSGIPVWWVQGSNGTLILVGTIRQLAPGTPWSHDKLVSALRRSDRVMFPGMVAPSLSLFDAWTIHNKARRMATLPRGHSLAAYVSPADLQRLRQLERRGVITAGIDRRHPLQIIQDLMQASKGEPPLKGFFNISRHRPGDDPESLIRSTVTKHKIQLVQPTRRSLNPALKSIFMSSPAQYLPCLRQAIGLAEAGPEAFRARSAAWANAQVQAVVASPFEQAARTCLPPSLQGPPAGEVAQQLRSLPNLPGTTMAVMDVSMLGAPSGVLDRLTQAGFKVRGPRWR